MWLTLCHAEHIVDEIVREDVGIPVMFVEISAVHYAKAVHAVHANLVRDEPNHWAGLLMCIVECPVFTSLKPFPQNPERCVWSDWMSIGYLGQRRQEYRINDVLIGQEQYDKIEGKPFFTSSLFGSRNVPLYSYLIMP